MPHCTSGIIYHAWRPRTNEVRTSADRLSVQSPECQAAGIGGRARPLELTIRNTECRPPRAGHTGAPWSTCFQASAAGARRGGRNARRLGSGEERKLGNGSSVRRACEIVQQSARNRSERVRTSSHPARTLGVLVRVWPSFFVVPALLQTTFPRSDVIYYSLSTASLIRLADPQQPRYAVLLAKRTSRLKRV